MRVKDAQRLNTYDALTGDVRVGVLASTTGEFRLLERTVLVDFNSILVAGATVAIRSSGLYYKERGGYLLQKPVF